jgi:zinc dependent phospholipase C
VFKIFADTHKIIARNIYDNIYNDYNLKLDINKLEWGAISPDILPHYRLIRHYKDESLNFISREVMKVIFISRFLDFNDRLDPIAIKILSNKIGVISHYLSDYVCLPHANRWTFFGNMKRHIKYEKKLDLISPNHDFKNNKISIEDLDIYDINPKELQTKIKQYINKVIEEYSLKSGYDVDLDFSVSINLKITTFILDTIAAYSDEINGHFAFQF